MTSLIDRVRDDAKSLSKKAGSEDRKTLDQYLTVVRETEKRLENMGQRTLNVDVTQLRRPDHAANLNEQVESMIDLIALALWTDSTRCITYMLGNSNSRMVFDFLGIQQQHHYLSHFFRNFSRSNLDSLLKISLWHMEKFDYLLTRLKSFKDQHGTLLDHTLVLYGSGMGHSDNHTATRIPIVLAGGKRIIKTGRYVRYSKNQQLGRLHLSLLQSFGVETQSFAQSSQQLAGLNSSDFSPWSEQPFESWVKIDGNKIEAQGRLRMSEDLDEAKIFYLDIKGQKSLRIDVSFRDFHNHNIAYHCGTPVNVRGVTSEKMGQSVITKVNSITSLSGNKPGSAAG